MFELVVGCIDGPVKGVLVGLVVGANDRTVGLVVGPNVATEGLTVKSQSVNTPAGSEIILTLQIWLELAEHCVLNSNSKPWGTG